MLLVIGGGMWVEFLVFLVMVQVAVYLHFNGQSLKTQTKLYAHLILLKKIFFALLFGSREHFRDLNCTGWCGLAGSSARLVYLFPGFSHREESCVHMRVLFSTYWRRDSFCLHMLLNACAHETLLYAHAHRSFIDLQNISAIW